MAGADALLLPWQRPAWQHFSQAFAAGRLAHALLLHAPGGLHKRQLAERIARTLLCARPDPLHGACGSCKHCLLMAAGNHPDWRVVVPASSVHVLIDQIRALAAQLAQRPQLATRQVVLLAPAESMTTAAANALLKTLEEPSADTHFLLLGERLGRIPVTIRSRCQTLALRPANPDEGEDVAALAGLAGAPIDAARLALQLAAGDAEAAEGLLQQGALEAVEALAAQLLALAEGRQDAVAFMAAVGRDAGRQLADFSRLLRLLVHGDSCGRVALDRLIGLTSRIEMSRLSALASRLEWVRQQAGSGLREDLLVLDLAERWKAVTNTGGRGDSR